MACSKGEICIRQTHAWNEKSQRFDGPASDYYVCGIDGYECLQSPQCQFWVPDKEKKK